LAAAAIVASQDAGQVAINRAEPQPAGTKVKPATSLQQRDSSGEIPGRRKNLANRVPESPWRAHPLRHTTGYESEQPDEAAMQLQIATTLDPVSRDFYQSGLRYLQKAAIPFLVGGAYSFARHTALERHTKDLDIFVRPDDCDRALTTLAAAGYSVELTFPHWLGKAFSGDNCIDIIFSSGNGVARVDDGWFIHALKGRVFDTLVLLCPIEETIWSKAFVMERERFDGADIAHLIRSSGRDINWQRLLDRFGPHWRVLLSHLVMFGFIYPGERDTIPAFVTGELMKRLRKESAIPPPADRICQGTIVSRAQYLVDLEQWGYEDARLNGGYMTPADIDIWTDAIATELPTPAVRPTYRSD
jgi:hypothetical protein